MNNIPKFGIYTPAGIDQKLPASYANKKSFSSQNSYPSSDRAELSEDWPQQIDWNEAARDTISHLQQSFPKVNIATSKGLNGNSLKHAAAQLGTGTHLILSEDFLKRMGSSQEEYEACKTILTKILQQLSGASGTAAANGAYVAADGATFWTANPEEKNILPPKNTAAQSLFDSLNKKSEQSYPYVSVKVSFSISSVYTRLAAAPDKSGVRAAMSDAHRRIGAMRTAAVFGTDEERIKARKAIYSLQKLLLRGNQKIDKITESELMQQRKKRAEKQEEMQKAMQIQAEMKRRKAAMHSRNWALVNEGKTSDWYIQNRSKDKEYDPYQGLPGGYDPMSATAGIPDVSGIGGVGGTIAVSDVVISDTVSF